MKLKWILIMALVTIARTAPAQVIRTQEIPIGTISDFYRHGEVAFAARLPRNSARFLAIRVIDSLNEYQVGITDLTLTELATVIKNLQKMLDESTQTSDELF